MPDDSSTKAPAKALKKRSVVPIPDTITRIPKYPPKLIIFQVASSPYWWARTYEGRPIKRSLKTTDKREAIAAAKDFYDEILLNKRQSINNNPKKSTFAYCAQQVIAEDMARADRDELSESYAITQRGLINKHIKDYFKQIEVADIDYMFLDGFRNYLFNLKLVPATVKANFVPVKKILDYAQKANIIKTSPLLPSVKNEDNPRGYFNVREYRLLRTTARQMIGSLSEVKQRKVVNGKEIDKKLRNIIVSEELLYLISFMIYTFIRPTDLKSIKHEHIEIRHGAEGDYLWMPIPPSKGHGNPITSMPRAAIFYKKLVELRRRERGDPQADLSKEYLFMPQHENRKYAYRQLARQFNVVLAAADLKDGPMGEPRTLYSLRHTSLMYRARYGGEIDAFKLAKNARTSSEMLERFYLSKLESSHFTASLHARKPSKRSRKQTTIYMEQPKPLTLSDMMEQARAELTETARDTTLEMRDGQLSVAGKK